MSIHFLEIIFVYMVIIDIKLILKFSKFNENKNFIFVLSYKMFIMPFFSFSESNCGDSTMKVRKRIRFISHLMYVM